MGRGPQQLAEQNAGDFIKSPDKLGCAEDPKEDRFDHPRVAAARGRRGEGAYALDFVHAHGTSMGAPPALKKRIMVELPLPWGL